MLENEYKYRTRKLRERKTKKKENNFSFQIYSEFFASFAELSRLSRPEIFCISP